ncbi:MFS general substrate transporter [Meira miltonrushii]|uniref:MFS general substrate transporter n=1 Tax=Meira miltonrushii TaxID=1280837 RepID=A0A316VBH0_9BASI|nr:MFS general substrate transporter [Meira miltonrushii]PWN34866.1 MFS general substrate transporter [Meira miltonrushii]
MAFTVFHSILEEALLILIIGLSQLFAVGGLSNTAYSIVQIGQSLGATSNGQMSWFMASYSLCAGVFVLVSGRMGDHLGHKYVFLFGWAWMAIWSLISGFAHNIILFDVARAMTGVGCGALVPNSFALLTRSFPPFSTKKSIAFAFLGFCAPSGYIFGGFIGAIFAEKVTWRWGYWFWAIGCLALFALSYFTIPHSDFDYLGSFLASVIGWQEGYTYAFLIVGVVLISYDKASVLPNSLWKRKGFTPVVIAMSFGWMSFGIFLYYTTVFILFVHKASPLTAVAQMVPLVIGVGIFITKVPAQYIFGVSMFSFFIGNLLMSFADYSNIYWAFIFPACLLVVGGPDLSFASSILPEEQGVAGSFISTVVQYSISIGLGFAATVETHVNNAQGTKLILAYKAAHWLGIGLAAIAFLIVIFFVRDHRFDDKHDDQ